jgi:hypothetical protein
MISDKYFQNISQGILERSEEFTLWILDRLRILQERAILDRDINLSREVARLEAQYEVFLASARDWTDEELSRAYRRGLELNKGQVVAGFVAGSLVPQFPTMPLSSKALEVLKDYPQHHTMYGVFQRAAYSEFEATRFPIIRETTGRIREITVLASDPSYRQEATLTRRALSQELQTRYAKDGITGIVYSDGRTMKLDSYSEMMARTQTGNAARQANLNRLQEYGQDLVQISVHFPTSPMCEPHQGKVFSISGTDSRYPRLDDAIADGLYHVNCKHSQSGFTEGVNVPIDKDNAQNAEQYEAMQAQRYNERQIRQWKRREVSSVDPIEREKAKAKVSEWQSRQREHLNKNGFLRRDYSREQI